MRNGDIALTPGTDGPYAGKPALVIGRKGYTTTVHTGRFELVYETAQLMPHGRARRIKTYRTLGHNEFAQFNVNFGEFDCTVDVKVTDSLYKIEDLRKAAFLEALEKFNDSS